MSRYSLISVISIAGLMSCVSQPAQTMTPAVVLSDLTRMPTGNAALPDLIVFYVYLEVQGRTENCISPNGSPMGYEVRVVVKNVGVAPAGNFDVEFNGVRQSYTDQLLPDQIQVFHFSDIQPGQATVDAANLVAEVNENNNSFQYLGVTPTPVMLCTPTPTPVS